MNDAELSVLRSFEVSLNPDALISLGDTTFRVMRVNAALERLLNLPREAIVGHPFGDLVPLGASELNHVDLRVAGSTIFRCHAGNRAPFWCRADVSPVPGDGRAGPCCLCSLHDVSEYVALRDSLAPDDVCRTDARTGSLPNALVSEIARAAAAGVRLLVCYVRVDHLGIFDELGDLQRTASLVAMVRQRLSECLPMLPRWLGRTASGAFVAIFELSDDAVDGLAAARGVAQAFVQPFVVDAGERRLTSSVGASCFPDTATDAHTLLHQAAVAAYAVRRSGGNGVRFFSVSADGNLSRRSEIAAELDGAVERGEMELLYQPICSTSARQVSGMEALLRWRNPRLGLVTPGEFIPIAEHLGVIGDIGRWVLFEACAQARRWLERGVGDFTMSVNVSRRQLRQRHLLEDVRRAIDTAGLQAGMLELEITETAVLHHVDQAMRILSELRRMGVKIAMDDFGTGESSLSFLGRLPINRMKIDQSFVAAIPHDVNAARICRAIIGLAHEFGQSVVAEGVEQPVQLSFLERNGCEFVQGFLIGKPSSADAMLALLRTPAMAYPHTPAPDSGSGNILIVDDEPNVLHALARLLRRDGYRVFSASTIAAAFDVLGTRQIQIVISDQRMPDSTGTEFLGRVKAMYPQTIRMILSGYADLGAVTEAINGGAVYRFLTKPWDDEKLREVVRSALRDTGAVADDA